MRIMNAEAFKGLSLRSAHERAHVVPVELQYRCSKTLPSLSK